MKNRRLFKGGIERKVILLVLSTLVIALGAYIFLTLSQSNMLSEVAGEANQRQKETISETTTAIMDGVVTENVKRQSALEAQITDDMFRSAKSRVMMIADFATQVFAHPENYTPHAYAPPKKENNGVLAAHVLMADGTDPEDPEVAASLGLVANMSEMMISLSEVTNVANAYLGLPNGTFLSVSRNSGEWYLEDGSLKSYDPRTRHWYNEAAEGGELVFSDVEVDATTGLMNVVCAMPVYGPDGELAAVAGSDLYIDDIQATLGASEVEGGFRVAVNGDGHVIFTTLQEPEFQARISAEAADLRQSANTQLADLVTDALQETTDVRRIEMENGRYYMIGVPLKTVGWSLITGFDEGLTVAPGELLQEKYSEIQGEAVGEYRQRIRKDQHIAMIFVAALAAILLSVGTFVSKRIARPLNTMTKRLGELGEGNPVFRMEDEYRTGDEIQIFAEKFATLSQQTVEYVKEVRRVTAENERIGTELDLARRIQADMLPSQFPAFPEKTEKDIFASMRPAKEVGGDFYDFFMLDEDHMGLVMADVSGKGVPAALFMMVSMILTQNFAKDGGKPSEVLAKLNEKICQNNRMQMFVTVWLGILDLKTGKITAANAGHEYPVLQGPDGTFAIVKDKHGFVIGGLQGVKYKDYELQMSKGSKLFVYTDGVPEATNAQGEFFGTERLVEVLNENAGEKPEVLVDRVHLRLRDFVGEAEQFDDITMMCVEYRG